MTRSQPSRKSLFFAWLSLIGLTVVTMLAGRVTLDIVLGGTLMSLLLVVTGTKALWILRYYLNLRAAPVGWRSAFVAFIGFLLLLIFVLYLVGLSS